jgi:hypothetical protein
MILPGPGAGPCANVTYHAPAPLAASTSVMPVIMLQEGLLVTLDSRARSVSHGEPVLQTQDPVTGWTTPRGRLRASLRIRPAVQQPERLALRSRLAAANCGHLAAARSTASRLPAFGGSGRHPSSSRAATTDSSAAIFRACLGDARIWLIWR